MRRRRGAWPGRSSRRSPNVAPSSYPATSGFPLSVVLSAMEDAGVRIDTYRMGEITARLSDASRSWKRVPTSSPARVHHRLAAAARAGPLRETRAAPGAWGKTGYSTDVEGAPCDPLDHGFPVVEEWRADEAREAPSGLYADAHRRRRTGRLHTTFNQTVAATGRPSTSIPTSEHPDPYGAGPRDPLGVRRRARAAPARVRGLLADRAAHPRARVGRAGIIESSRAARTFTRRRQPRCSRRIRPRHEGRADHRQDGQLRDLYGVSAFGLSQATSRSPRRRRRRTSTRTSPASRACGRSSTRTFVQASGIGYATTLLGRSRYLPELRAMNRRTRAFGERMAMNSSVQGSTADIIKMAMVACTSACARRAEHPHPAAGARRAAARRARDRGVDSATSSSARR